MINSVEYEQLLTLPDCLLGVNFDCFAPPPPASALGCKADVPESLNLISQDAEASLLLYFPRVTRSTPPIPVVPRQNPQSRHQDALRLLDPHRPSTPPLPHRPLADRAREANDVQDAAAGRAAEATKRNAWHV